MEIFFLIFDLFEVILIQNKINRSVFVNIDNCVNTIIINNGNITIKRKNYKGKVSQSATYKKKLFIEAKDAVMHSSLTMSNANSESSTNSRKEKAQNIGRESQITKKNLKVTKE